MEREPDLGRFVEEARGWLDANAQPRTRVAATWGSGTDDVSVFHDLDEGAERALLERLMEWQRRKFDAGYGAISWPVEHGGAGLPVDYERAFLHEEADYETPPGHETFSVTTHLVAPTIRMFGTPEQKDRLIRPLLRTAELCCQLFSEPGAGSDLAGLATRAVRDGDEWIVTGQKVWSSGARFSAWGLLICRTDPHVPKHKGLTAFMVPMDAQGVQVRPIRQMTGGASFNEVFLDGVRVADDLRLGAVGDGWRVTLATLAFERAASGANPDDDRGGSWDRVLGLARHLGATDDPMTRQRLAELYTLHRVRALSGARLVAMAQTNGDGPGPLGSIGKLQWTQWMSRVSDVASGLLGARVTADTGEWGTFAWTSHLLGAPGYRIAGGSDEIQRTIIGERVLGLPSEPRVDRDVPFSQIPR